MQARVRNNSASDGGWEELSLPDEVRSVNSSLLSEDDEIVILGGNASPRPGDIIVARRDEIPQSPSTITLEALRGTPVPSIAISPVRAKDDQLISSSVVQPTQPPVASVWTISQAAKNLTASPADLDKSLSPVEKTLLHQITKLSEELENSKQRNQLLEQTAHRDDLATLLQEEDGDNHDLFRLGLKAFGFFMLLSVVQRKFLMSGFVSIFGAAVVGGLLTYEQESCKRRRQD